MHCCYSAWEIINSSLDPVEIKQAMSDFLTVLSSEDNTGYLPFFNHRQVWLISPKMKNMVGNPSTATGNWNTEDWWLSD